ncbi:hypothetical protein SISNIDRAFT_35375 [Sistotremastrum niveocremeum HHB9708]|uniref:N-acetyltransferase domain-containing protein n=1 Tax=Sistotremastrum niveocremeum HHB9708 TaxID=1314777 RepID=A0A164WCB8_9AGAM|nr:hypothetical protein SISNIDRAFT_35375 [Sistotremastrum niveocremeum HHB9708]
MIGTLYEMIQEAFVNDTFYRFRAGGDGTTPPKRPNWFRRLLYKILLACWIRRRVIWQVGGEKAVLMVSRAVDDPLAKPTSFLDRLLDYIARLAALLYDSYSGKIVSVRNQELVEEKNGTLKAYLGDRMQSMLHVHLVATSPEYRGRGYGGRLMEKVNEFADSQGRATWLIASGHHNIPFYNSHGYFALAEMVNGRDSPNWKRDPVKTILMVRESPESEVKIQE